MKSWRVRPGCDFHGTPPWSIALRHIRPRPIADRAADPSHQDGWDRSLELWLLIAWLAFLILLVLPWMMRHSP